MNILYIFASDAAEILKRKRQRFFENSNSHLKADFNKDIAFEREWVIYYTTSILSFVSNIESNMLFTIMSNYLAFAGIDGGFLKLSHP